MTSRAKRAWGLGLLAWLALWGLRMVVMRASGAGLHVDEAQYWWWSTELAWGYYSKPPMIAALIHASTTLFGDGLVGVRALGMACWVAASAVMWRWGVAQGHSRAGWVAALLLAATPLSGILGLVVTTDGPLVLCWALAMAGTWAQWQHPPASARSYWGRWCLLGVVFGLALLSKYTALMMGPAWLLLWFVQAPGQHARWFWGMALASAVGLLMLSPNVWWNAANAWPTLQHTLDITVRAGDASTSVANHVGSALGFLAGQVFLLGPAAVSVAVLIWRQKRSPSALRADPAGWDRAIWHWTMAFAGPLLLVGLVQAARAKAQVNWAAPALVSLSWGLGWWAVRVGVSRRALVTSVATGVALSLVLALGGDLRRWVRDGELSERNQWDVWARMRGWHETLQQLKLVRDAQDPRLPVVAAGRTTLTQVAYEWRDRPKPWSWNDMGLVENHFDWWRHLNPEEHTDILYLGDEPPPRLMSVYPQAQLLASAHSGRVRLKLWHLRR